jgi:hypothetical protein
MYISLSLSLSLSLSPLPNKKQQQMAHMQHMAQMAAMMRAQQMAAGGVAPTLPPTAAAGGLAPPLPPQQVLAAQLAMAMQHMQACLLLYNLFLIIHFAYLAALPS